MTKPRALNIAIGQLNPTVGDIHGNIQKTLRAHKAAAQGKADLLLLSELFLSGYPPEDLVLRPAFMEAVESGLAELAEATRAMPAILIGAPLKGKKALYNAAFLLKDGDIAAAQKKTRLPNYDVFDEKRIFAPANKSVPMTLKEVSIGVLICEDMWKKNPAKMLKKQGADLFLVLNGSPFDAEKQKTRLLYARDRARETRLPLLYVNQCGGQDELVFDGASFALHGNGKVAAKLAAFEEAIAFISWTEEEGFAAKDAPFVSWAEGEEANYLAIMMGLRDYVEKNGFPGVVLGLSGGIDSALAAALAVDALGPKRARCVMLPSAYSSEASLRDAADCAKRLGVQTSTLAIADAVKALQASLPESEKSVVEENLQARARGVLLMALSNMSGEMVLTTGNKSEMSVGYATLYGDMNGGFNPLKDIYKMQVYDLARFRNAKKPRGAMGPDGAVIPEAILTKAPSAELKPDQRDDDTLPVYPILDDILKRLIDDEEDKSAIIEAGHDAQTVARVMDLARRAEYKRRQAPPGVKIGPRSFGRGRRYPITNGFRD